MLSRSPTDGPVTGPEPQTASRSASSLLPLPNVTSWSLMSKVQRPSTLKPLLQQEKLRRLPNTPLISSSDDFTADDEQIDWKDCSQAERRNRFLENSIKFLRQEHEELLSALHHEVDSLKRTNQNLQFRLLMAEEQIIVDRRRYSFAKTMEAERRLKQEAAARELETLTHCEPIERVHVGVPSAAAAGAAAWIDLPQSPRQPGSKSRSCDQWDNTKPPLNLAAASKPATSQKLNLEPAGLAPLLSAKLPPPASVPKTKPCLAASQSTRQSLPQSVGGLLHPAEPAGGGGAGGLLTGGPQSAPVPADDTTGTTTDRDCRAVIRRLQAENQRQAAELEQVKANLRDMVRSQKLPTDRQMMVARASALLSAATADCSQTQQQQQQCQQCAHRQMIISRKQRVSELDARIRAGNKSTARSSTGKPLRPKQPADHQDDC